MSEIFSPRRGCRLVCLAIFALLSTAPGFPAETIQLHLVSQADPPLPAPGGQILGDAVTSADGRYIAFASNSFRQVPGQEDFNREYDVFLYDRVSGETVLVSRTALSPTRTGQHRSISPSISADGRYVAFSSQSDDLVAGQVGPTSPYDNDTEDVFLFDRVTGTTTLVSRANGTTTTDGNSDSYWPMVSADGNYVVFTSQSTNLVPGLINTSQAAHIFLYERASGTVTLVSRAAGSTATTANGNCDYLPTALSADGRYVAYRCNSTNLVSGQIDTNGGYDVFLFDRSTGTSILVSHASYSATTAGDHGGQYLPVSLSADGRWVVFASSATNLVTGQLDASNTNDVFLFDRDTGVTTLISRTNEPGAVSARASGGGVISADGAYVTFSSANSNLVAGQIDTNGKDDVFVFDRAAGSLTLVSRAAGSADAAGDGSTEPAVSADGALIAFLSSAVDLIAGQSDSNGTQDCFLYERATGAVTLVSRAVTSSTEAAGKTSFCRVVAGGSHAVVASAATLVASPPDLADTADFFLFDRAAGANSAISLLPEALSLTANRSSSARSLSADGRWLAFNSSASNLTSSVVDANGSGEDAFLYDRLTGTHELISHRADSAVTTGNASSFLWQMSADTRFVHFTSTASDLVAGQQSTGLTDLYLRDRMAGTTTLLSRSASSPNHSAGGLSTDPQMSADGRFITWNYFGAIGNLVPGTTDGNQDYDVVLYDRVAGTILLVSRAAGSSSSGNAWSGIARISSDGRYVLFGSSATNVVPGQVDHNTNSGAGDFFLYDRISGTTTLVTRSATSANTTANSGFLDGTLSADGRFVAYSSLATNIVPGQIDTYRSADVFLFDRVTGTTTLVSHASGSAVKTCNAPSGSPFVSPDGHLVSFATTATDCVTGVTDSNGDNDLFLYDRETGTTTLISHAAGSPTVSAGISWSLSFSPDGRALLFASQATNLVPEQQGPAGAANAPVQLFIYDRATGSTKLLSGVGGSRTLTANSYSDWPVPSSDGRTVAFTSNASNLATGDLNDLHDVFLWTTTAPGSYFTLTPCRVIDTRQAQDGPALASGVSETWTLHGFCGIPAAARAVAVNVTVTQSTGDGHLTLWSGDAGAPLASTLNFGPGQTRANNAILPLSATGSGSLAIRATVSGGGTVHVLVDVVGYFE